MGTTNLDALTLSGALSVTGAVTVAGAMVFNDDSGDVDFRVESNGLAYALYVDGAKDSIVIGDNTDVSDIDVRLRVGNVAKTLLTGQSAAILHVAPTAATTEFTSGTHAYIASAYFSEPNITAGSATTTVAATVYIANAPTEGTTNASLYVASPAASNGIYVSSTVGATNDRALKISVTQATPAMADGYGVIEKELNVTGTATGHITAESSWINLGTSAVVPDYLDVHNDGIYDGTATLTNALLSWAKFQCILASNPARMSLWELNFSGAHSEVDALFSVNDPTLALGYQAGTPTAAAIGSIPFAIDTNGTIYYIYLHAAADAD